MHPAAAADLKNELPPGYTLLLTKDNVDGALEDVLVFLYGQSCRVCAKREYLHQGIRYLLAPR